MAPPPKDGTYPPPPHVELESGRYASKWNAFLFPLFWCRQILTSQMGIVAPNLRITTAFLRPKIPVAATV